MVISIIECILLCVSIGLVEKKILSLCLVPEIFRKDCLLVYI